MRFPDCSVNGLLLSPLLIEMPHTVYPFFIQDAAWHCDQQHMLLL